MPEGVLGAAREHVASFPPPAANYYGTADAKGFHVYRVTSGEVQDNRELTNTTGRLPSQFGIQDHDNGWAQIMARIARIETAIVRLAGGGPDNGEEETSNGAVFTDTRNRGAADRAVRRPAAGVWHALDAATNRDINTINASNKRHYKVN